jgi:hypothetical protein
MYNPSSLPANSDLLANSGICQKSSHQNCCLKLSCHKFSSKKGQFWPPGQFWSLGRFWSLGQFWHLSKKFSSKLLSKKKMLSKKFSPKKLSEILVKNFIFEIFFRYYKVCFFKLLNLT